MDTMFLSYSFDPEDRDTQHLLGYLDTVLRAHGWRTVTGEALGGGGLTDEIRQDITDSDALLSLLAPRGAAKADGTFATSDWVRDELQYARAIDKPCVAMVFDKVGLPAGMFSERERIDYDPRTPTAALLKLVAILGLWKQRLGRPVKIRIEPMDLANLLRFNGAARCEARITRGAQVVQDWEPVRVSPQVGGVFVSLRLPEDALVQLRADVSGERWSSLESQQWVHIPLEKQP